MEENVLNEINKFRHNPSAFVKEFQTLAKALKRTKKTAEKGDELEKYLVKLNSEAISPLKFSKALSSACKDEIDNVLKGLTKSAHKTFHDIKEMVSKYCTNFNHLAMLLDHGSIDSMIPRFFVSEYDPGRHNRAELLNKEYAFCGVATTEYNDDTLTVVIFADFVEEIIHEKDEHVMYFHDLSDLKKAFDYFDVNKSGLVDPHELKSCLRAVGFDLKNPTIFNLISSLDTPENHLGFDFQTFALAFDKELGNDRTKNGLFKLFTLFINNPNQFTLNEASIRRLCNETGEVLLENEAKEILERASLAGNELEFEEFYNIMTGK